MTMTDPERQIYALTVCTEMIRLCRIRGIPPDIATEAFATAFLIAVLGDNLDNPDIARAHQLLDEIDSQHDFRAIALDAKKLFEQLSRPN